MSEYPFGISVVIPAYNRAVTLRRAIESVDRPPGPVEIIVVDDGSIPSLEQAIPASNRHGVAVRYYRLARNRGPQAARNLGIRRARFRFIAFLDSDDEFVAGKVATVYDLLASDTVDLLFHAVIGMERYDRLAGYWARNRDMLPFIWLLSLYNPVVTPALVIRRGRRLGAPNLRHCEDYAFLLHYVDTSTRVVYLGTPLTRVHRAQGEVGGLSAARWRMRRGEFAARAMLLRSGRLVDLLRLAVGTLAGSTRIVADVLRGRYRFQRPAAPLWPK